MEGGTLGQAVFNRSSMKHGAMMHLGTYIPACENVSACPSECSVEAQKVKLKLKN